MGFVESITTKGKDQGKELLSILLFHTIVDAAFDKIAFVALDLVHDLLTERFTEFVDLAPGEARHVHRDEQHLVLLVSNSIILYILRKGSICQHASRLKHICH